MVVLLKGYQLNFDLAADRAANQVPSTKIYVFTSGCIEKSFGSGVSKAKASNHSVVIRSARNGDTTGVGLGLEVSIWHTFRPWVSET